MKLSSSRNSNTILVLGTAAILIGCAGTTGNSYNSSRGKARFKNNQYASQSNTTHQSIPLFLTNSTGQIASKSWVTIYKIKLESAKDSWVIYDNEVGNTLDLAALRGESDSKFLYMGSAYLPKGDKVIRALVTLSREYKSLEKKSKMVKKYFTDSTHTQASKITYSITLNDKQEISEKNPAIIDFDFGNCIQNSEGLSELKLALSDSTKYKNSSNQLVATLKGKVLHVNNLNSDKTYTLETVDKQKATILSNHKTLVFDSKGNVKVNIFSQSKILARGYYDCKQNRLIAKSIYLEKNKEDQSYVFTCGRIARTNFKKDTVYLEASTIEGESIKTTEIPIRVSRDSLLFDGPEKKIDLMKFVQSTVPGTHVAIRGKLAQGSGIVHADWAHLEI